MRLVYMGSPQLSVYPLEHLIKNADSHGHKIVASVSQAARVAGRGRNLREDPPLAKFAKQAQILTLQPEKASDPDFQKHLRELEPDVIITCAYGQILNTAFLAIPKRATINIHPSLLPKYRGATPVQTALLDGLTSTGNTILFTIKELDAGNIIRQEPHAIAPTETADALSTRLFTLAGPLLVQALTQLQDPTFVGQQQDASAVSLCRKIHKEDGFIDWNSKASAIYNRFRAFASWPSSFTYLEGKRMIITGIEPTDLRQESAEPGSLIFRKELQGLYVACQEGCLKLTALKPEGSRVLTSMEFWNGLKKRDHLKFSPTHS